MHPLAPYRLALDAIMMDFTGLIVALIRSGYDPQDREASITRLVDPVTALVRSSRHRVYDEAVAMLLSQAAAQGVSDGVYVPGISGYPEDSVRTVLREALRGTPTEAAQAIAARLTQHVESAGRQTITRAVEDGMEPGTAADAEHMEHTRLTPEEMDELRDHEAPPPTPHIRPRTTEAQNPDGARPKAWARVLTGAENCAFCVMLASRGPVYETAATAGRLAASDAFKDAGATGWVNSYHPSCDCVVVPVYSYTSWPGRASYRELEKLYARVINQEWQDDDGETQYGISYNRGPSSTAKNQVIAALDRELARMDRDGITLPVDNLRS